MAVEAGIKPGGPFTGEAEDAAALLMLAMQAAGSSDGAAIQKKMLSVANTPSTKVMPGEIAKGRIILKDGGDIDYVGASNVEFNSIGELLRSFKELEINNSKIEAVRIRQNPDWEKQSGFPRAERFFMRSATSLHPTRLSKARVGTCWTLLCRHSRYRTWDWRIWQNRHQACPKTPFPFPGNPDFRTGSPARRDPWMCHRVRPRSDRSRCRGSV